MAQAGELSELDPAELDGLAAAISVGQGDYSAHRRYLAVADGIAENHAVSGSKSTIRTKCSR